MFIEAEVWNVAHTDQGYAVLIKPIGTNAAIPIFVGQLEAQSILIGMGDIPMPRPNTHDLFLQSLSKTGNVLEKIEITEIRDGIFYSTVYINNTAEIITLDSRPSDSIALAVRADCPIFITEDIIDEAGISIQYINDKTETISSEKEEKRVKLESALEEAVKSEKYEEAARIRDEIKKLEDESL